ncbi:hypothetical protein AJ78_07417 [Emergomyces pasteurianus Ep9510]|uniref:C2H2-type domain-containing protein n=1 Tax=Emergomyces pasteurianus Ep9510 TaxID=1447872 RepID=A0A1J9Q6R7_9EURO|nr:hypothetical protein AJ78_07417 [Emergomyces pasteurianus Ep9510]
MTDLNHRFDKKILDERYCFQCGKEFASAKSLWLHKKNNHLESSRSRIDAFRQFRRAYLSRTLTSGNAVHSTGKQNQQCISVVEETAADKSSKLLFHNVMQPPSTGSEMFAFDYSIDSLADPRLVHSTSIGPSGSIFDYSIDSLADPRLVHSTSICPSGSIFDYSVDSSADPCSAQSSIDGNRSIFDYRVNSILDPQAAQQYAIFNYSVDSTPDLYLSTCSSGQYAHLEGSHPPCRDYTVVPAKWEEKATKSG